MTTRAFLSLSGLILSPTFLAHWQAQTPPSSSVADPLNLPENFDAFKESSTKISHSGQAENESEALATNNSNGRNREVLLSLWSSEKCTFTIVL